MLYHITNADLGKSEILWIEKIEKSHERTY